MSRIDPFKVVRNTDKLQALRQHQQATRAAAQPFMAIGQVALALEITLILFELLIRHSFRDKSLPSSLLIFLFGVSFGIAGVRTWLYRRSHPFVLTDAALVCQPLK